MNTFVMPHNASVLFLISLTEEKIREIESKKVNTYHILLNQIRAFKNVEVHEIISKEILDKAAMFNKVIIVGHQVGGFIQQSDGSFLPMEELVNFIPPECCGYLHVAICGSEVIRSLLNQRCNALVRCAPKQTQVELVLWIYTLILSYADMPNFSQLYDSTLRTILENQSKKSPSELSKLPYATTLGDMVSIGYPQKVLRNSSFIVEIKIHSDEIEIEVKDNIKERGDKYQYTKNIQLKIGSEIVTKLTFSTANHFPNLDEHLYAKDGPIQTKTWNGRKINVVYECFVDEFIIQNTYFNSFDGTLNLTIDNEPIEDWTLRFEFSEIYMPMRVPSGGLNLTGTQSVPTERGNQGELDGTDGGNTQSEGQESAEKEEKKENGISPQNSQEDKDIKDAKGTNKIKNIIKDCFDKGLLKDDDPTFYLYFLLLALRARNLWKKQQIPSFVRMVIEVRPSILNYKTEKNIRDSMQNMNKKAKKLTVLKEDKPIYFDTFITDHDSMLEYIDKMYPKKVDGKIRSDCQLVKVLADKLFIAMK